jgi:hypothetical protein
MKLRVFLALGLAAVLCAPAARADGDPASDYLLSQNTFLPFDAKIPVENAKQLNAIVADAKTRGYTIRVAVIAKQFDLGAVPSLWRKPQTYALFLGKELFFVYKGRLLVVMPNGFGVSKGGKELPDAERVVGKLRPPGDGGAALTASATRAVQRLAASDGVHVAIPTVSSGDSSNSDRLVIAAIAGGLLLLLGIGFAARRFLLSRRAHA